MLKLNRAIHSKSRKSSIYQEDTMILNMHATNDAVLKYIKQNGREINTHPQSFFR